MKKLFLIALFFSLLNVKAQDNNQWDFEAGIGLGGIYYFVPRNNFGIKPYWEKTLNLHLRFGYSF